MGAETMAQRLGTSFIALGVIIGLTINVGFVFLGAWLFRVRLDAVKVTLSLLAAITAGFVAGLLLGPVFTAVFSSIFTQGLAVVVNSIVLSAVQLLVSAACLTAIAGVTPRMGWALATFTSGVQLVMFGLLFLYLIGAGGLPAATTAYAWIPIAMGASFLGGGYWLGSGAAAQEGVGGMAVIEQRSAHVAISEGGSIGPITIEDRPSPRPQRPTEGSRPTRVPEPPAESGWLVVSVGQEKGRRYDLKQGDNRIGRSSECDVRVTGDEEMSREHCLIRLEGRSYVLHDLASRNGTFLNESPVRGERSLADDDEIRVGNSVLIFKQVG